MDQSVQRGTKTIRLPISELEYSQFLTDRNHAHEKIRDCIQKFPELLPKDIIAGYHFCGFTEASKKIADFRQRRIKLVGNGISYIIAPGFVMPYMMGKVDELDKGLVLVGAGTPCDIISYVCGRNESFWHRCANMFGRCSIVGTTI